MTLGMEVKTPYGAGHLPVLVYTLNELVILTQESVVGRKFSGGDGFLPVVLL